MLSGRPQVGQGHVANRTRGNVWPRSGLQSSQFAVGVLSLLTLRLRLSQSINWLAPVILFFYGEESRQMRQLIYEDGCAANSSLDLHYWGLLIYLGRAESNSPPLLRLVNSGETLTTYLLADSSKAPRGALALLSSYRSLKLTSSYIFLLPS